MSDTPSTPSHGRKFRWRKSYLLLVPVLLLGIVEFFVDPFPDSIWALRILNTKYLVHVRADLTVDGEPLVMERTIRCFDPVDYSWYPGTFSRMNVLSSDGQAGDTIAATTKSGRLFAMTGLNVCHVIGSRPDTSGDGFYTWTDPTKHDVKPLVLSNGDIPNPVVFEIHGGRAADTVDAFIARDQLRQGYNGVRLNEIRIEKVGGLLLKDWNGYDWFGNLSWVRPFTPDQTRLYEAAYVVDIPFERWRTLSHLDARSLKAVSENPEYKAAMEQHLRDFLGATQDVVLQGGLTKIQFFSGLENIGIIPSMEVLTLPRVVPHGAAGIAASSPEERTLIHCEYEAPGPVYKCDASLRGIVRLEPAATVDHRVVSGGIQATFRVEDVNIIAASGLSAAYLRHSDRRFFYADCTSLYLVRK